MNYELNNVTIILKNIFFRIATGLTCKAVKLDGGVEGPELLLERVHRLDQSPELGLGPVGGLSLRDSDNISGGFAGTVVLLQSVSVSA